MKMKIENTNKEFTTMADELPFTTINHSNIRFESDCPPVQLIPLLKSLSQSLFQTDNRSTRERGKVNESNV